VDRIEFGTMRSEELEGVSLVELVAGVPRLRVDVDAGHMESSQLIAASCATLAAKQV
jgi:hypothetical protein